MQEKMQSMILKQVKIEMNRVEIETRREDRNIDDCLLVVSGVSHLLSEMMLLSCHFMRESDR